MNTILSLPDLCTAFSRAGGSDTGNAEGQSSCHLVLSLGSRRKPSQTGARLGGTGHPQDSNQSSSAQPGTGWGAVNLIDFDSLRTV